MQQISFAIGHFLEWTFKILTGMGSLSGGELKNERINNAFQEKDQDCLLYTSPSPRD